MKDLFYLAFLLFFSSSLLGDQDFQKFENHLLPFSSDGCSGFPDHLGDTSWLHCCIQHDIAYWHGGTKQERSEADLEMRHCVSENAGEALGFLMNLGVLVGGHPNLPTYWNWGFGWVMDRGYKSLTESEVEKVTELIPDSYEGVIIKSPLYIPKRPIVTGDFCLDEALFQISRLQFKDFIEYRVTELEDKKSLIGYVREYSIETLMCHKPYKVRVHLMRTEICNRSILEPLAKRALRDLSIEGGCESH